MDEEEILSRAQRVVLQKADIVPDASFADLAFQEMVITARLGDIYGKIIGVLGKEIRPLDWNMTALHSYMPLHQLLESEGVSMRDRAAVLEYAASALALGVLRILGGRNSEVGKDEGDSVSVLEEQFTVIARAMELPSLPRE